MGKEYCSVKNCESNNSSDNIRLFKVRKSWQKLIDWKGKQGAKICNIHFRPEDIGLEDCLSLFKANAENFSLIVSKDNGGLVYLFFMQK